MNEAQKVFANFYGSSTPNLYQQQIQDFITASPENMQVYKDSGLKGAGLNAFMTTFPEALASNTIAGNILKNLKSTPGKIKEKLSGLYNTPQVQEILGLGEEDKNIKSSYSQYMNEMNKKIGASRADTGEISGETTPLGDIYGEDYIYDKDYMLPGAMEEAVLAGQEPYNPAAIAEDKEAQAEMDRSLLNQYSLLQDSDLASSLVDESMQTDEIIDSGFNNDIVNVMGEFPKATTFPLIQGMVGLSAPYGSAEGDFSEMRPSEAILNPDIVYSDVVSDTPKVGEEIRSADFYNLGYKDGGSLNTYEVLKLINNTMHDG